MRGNELLDKMELIDPAYIEAADTAPVRLPDRRRRLRKFALGQKGRNRENPVPRNRGRHPRFPARPFPVVEIKAGHRPGSGISD